MRCSRANESITAVWFLREKWWRRNEFRQERSPSPLKGERARLGRGERRPRGSQLHAKDPHCLVPVRATMSGARRAELQPRAAALPRIPSELRRWEKGNGGSVYVRGILLWNRPNVPIQNEMFGFNAPGRRRSESKFDRRWFWRARNLNTARASVRPPGASCLCGRDNRAIGRGPVC